jgi:hypothetical protein
VEKLEEELNSRGVPSFESVATNGNGVFETLTAATRMVLDELRDQLVQDSSKQEGSDGQEISFGTVGQAEQDSSTMKDKVSDVPSPGEEPSPALAGAGGSCPSNENSEAPGTQAGGSAGLGDSGYTPTAGTATAVESVPLAAEQSASVGLETVSQTAGLGHSGERKVRIPIRLADPGKTGHVVVNLAVDIEIVVEDDKV